MNKRISLMRRIGFPCFAATLATTLGGCSFLQAPEAEPIPKKETLPPADFFDPTANITPGIDLGGTWMVSQVFAGDIVQIQSVVPRLDKENQPVLNSAGQPVVTFGQPETVRLAGILVAPPGARGAEGARQTVLGWTTDKVTGRKMDLKVEQDKVYPTDPAGRRNVQIYFKGTTEKTKETLYNLNRMMVRSGFAVVDLYQATSINPEAWLNDEQAARLRIDPKDPEGKRIAPLGLWKLGIILGERQASPRTLPAAGAQAGGTTGAATPTASAVPDASGGPTAPIGGVGASPSATAAP